MATKKRQAFKRFAAWLPPRDALNRVTELAVVQSPDGVFLEYLRGGIIRSAAQRSSVRYSFGKTSKTKRFEIPQEYWDELTSSSDQLWNAGIACFNIRQFGSKGDDEETARCFGIRFEPSGNQHLIENLSKKRAQKRWLTHKPNSPEEPHAVPIEMPPAIQEPPRVENLKSPYIGGRPRKEWWDDLWVEMCRKIYVDGMQPKKQAEIEKAMLTWATSNGHDVSEGSIRVAARRLFAMFREEDKN